MVLVGIGVSALSGSTAAGLLARGAYGPEDRPGDAGRGQPSQGALSSLDWVTMRMNRELGLLDVLGALERAESDQAYRWYLPEPVAGDAARDGDDGGAARRIGQIQGAFGQVRGSLFRFLYPGYLLPQFSGRPSLPQSPELCCGRGLRRT